MGWVLADAVTVDDVVYAADTTPPPEVATRIGEHLRKETDEGGSRVDEVVTPEPAPIQIEDPDVEAEGLPGPVATEAPDESAPEGPTSTPVAVDEDPVVDSKDDAPTPEATAAIPPKGGPGSAKGAWAEYARANGVSVEPGASRDDIIRDLEDAGIATE